MKEINIAVTLMTKRKEKKITQDELAAYIGVSKASVSKWETGQSYPDITFLPQLAAYFNISIDQLLGYSPQMTKEDIRKLYHRLANDFSTLPFDDVITACREIIKKYYACFPLLLQMVILLINHYMLAEKKEDQEKILDEVIQLCIRIKEESQDLWLAKQANSLEALVHLMLQNPARVLDLLDGTIKPLSNDEPVLANAYLSLGKAAEAKKVLQISLYQHLASALSNVPLYLYLYSQNTEKFEQILQRFLSFAQLFEMSELHPNLLLQIYLAAAQGYVMQNNPDRSLDMLKAYSEICLKNTAQFTLHGDGFFDQIDAWFEDFDLGIKAPRDEKIIGKSMIQALEDTPVFSPLQSDPRFKNIIGILKLKLGDE